MKENPKPKLLVIAAHPGIGNAHIEKYLPALEGFGFDIHFSGWDRKSIFPKKRQKNGTFYQMIFRGGGGFSSRSLFYMMPIFMIRVFFHTMFSSQKQIFAIDFDTALPVALASIFRPKKLIVYGIRDNYAWRPWVPTFFRPVIQSVDRWTMKRFDRIIVPDETRILKNIPLSLKEKFEVVYNCAEDQIEMVSEAERERSGKPFTIYASGYLRKVRGIELLLEVANRIEDLQLIFAGDMPEEDIRIKMKALGHRADFRGSLTLEESWRLNFSADAVFAFYDPSFEINRRAASNKWSDAMMAGRPCLSNNELIKSEWIKTNDIGFTCPYNVDELEETVRYMMANREVVVLKGENGRQLYEQVYNWRIMKDRLRHIFFASSED